MAKTAGQAPDTLRSQEYVLVNVGDIQPHPRNPRQGDIGAIVESIKANGFYGACVVQRSTRYVLAGNHRLLAAIECGLRQVPVIWVDCNDEEALRILLVDNRSNDVAGYDDAKLAALLSEIQRDMGTLEGTGYDGNALETLLAELGEHAPTEGLTDEDAVPEVHPDPVSRLGDCWLLGAHRVVCGDSTEAAAVERLMQGEKADLVFTDLPYNVDYEGYTEEKLTIQGDKMPAAQFQEFLRAAFANCRRIVKPGASLYVCHPSLWQREFQDALEGAGFEVRCQIIWAKNTFAWGFGRYKFQHEPVFYAHVAGESDAWYGDKTQSTLWQENKPAANRLHPTMKPVELVERALLNSSKAGDLVVDLFGGSGSTLIACERRSRSARLMELDPRYTDVICRRYQEYTGKQAVLEGDGRSFDDAVRQRRQEAA